MDYMLYFFGLFAFFGIIAVIGIYQHKSRAQALAERTNREKGCLACGALKLEASGPHKVRCLSCGYEGAKDKGGPIDGSDVEKFIPHRYDT